MAGLEEKLCPVCFQEAMEHGECRNCGYHAEESSAVKDYLAPFTILKEKYLLGKSLGQGGFGITYLAENMQSGLRCCIKEYFPSGLLQGRTPDGALILADEENRPEYEEGKQQFIEEACALQELRENISVVDILDFFEENGTAYFAMELIEGCNLRVFRKNHNPKQTLKMALQMLFLLGSSLAEVHRFGMIHGDISPENILITQDGEIKLIDFGAARSFRQGSDNKERKIYLKPNYAPYEQYTQKPCQGPWTDIYALAATHVSGIIGADFDNGKGICGVAPNAKLYGVDWSDSPLYRTIDKKKPTFGDGSNLYCMKIAMLYLVVEKQCQVINISQSAFGVEVRCNASNNNDDAINVINKFNEEFASFLKYVRELSKMEFIICKCANNDNNHDLFFSKDADDDFNLPYILYSDYLKYMNGEFDSTDDETKKYWDEKFKRYAGRISKENCKTHSVNAQWDMISGITDPEIEDMIIVVGAAQNTGKHSSWGKCKHTGYEVTAYSNRGSRVDVLAPGGEKTIDGIPDASIYSTVPYGNGYDGLVGTSMACPHVAGVAAMIFGIDPTFTAKEVKDIIISTATGSYGSVKEQYPLLNARLAVEKAIKLSNEKAKGQTGDDLPFEPSGEHQYRIFYDALTWEEAKAACEAKGGHLATITSEEEQQKLNLYNAGNHKLWIGGYKNTEGQWCWVTGEPWEYENWGDGEPNNSSNVVAGESCVAMWPEKWNDLANSNVYEQSGYICEWEASDVAEETQVEGYTGHLYEFYTLPESEWESGPITWQQAERRCEWKGGHLAVIESSTENFLLYSAMKAKGYENAYFGYSDKSSEGNWKWVNGTSTAYTNWHSGEPNNQDGIEHYAMFYENFQDGTWNDADGIIDAGCAYICEWDDPTDKISQGDSFTDQQLRIIAKDLGVPDDLNVEIRQSPKAYWESAGLWDIYVEITHNGKLVASGSFDVETGEMGRNIYIYTPV